LINSVDGSSAGVYEYGPFGEIIRLTGPAANANPFGFSTKYRDPETDMLYYGYRYYNPSTGTWLSRDPLGEEGGRNLFSFALGDPMNNIDSDGLEISEAMQWILDHINEVLEELIKYVLIDRTKIIQTHDVVCPCGSQRHLVSEHLHTQSRKATASAGIGFHTLYSRDLEGAYYTHVEQTYACCASCGWFSIDTTPWKYTSDPDVEQTIWSVDKSFESAWIKGEVVDITKNYQRERKCKEDVTPRYSFDTSSHCVTHNGVTHCSP